MAQKHPAQNFFEDMQNKFQDMMSGAPIAPAFDVRSMMELQRKNMQAFTEANQKVMDGWQTLAQRQTEMVSQFVQDNSNLMRETMKEGTPQDKFGRQAEILKKSCELTLENSKELGEIVRKNSMETANILSKRVMDTMSEIKTGFKAKE